MRRLFVWVRNLDTLWPCRRVSPPSPWADGVVFLPADAVAIGPRATGLPADAYVMPDPRCTLPPDARPR